VQAISCGGVAMLLIAYLRDFQWLSNNVMRWRGVGRRFSVGVGFGFGVGVLMMFGGFMGGWLRIGGVMTRCFGKYRLVQWLPWALS
jgi:hypothetical protein